MGLKEIVVADLKEAAKRSKKSKGKQYFLYAHWKDIKELLEMGIKQKKILEHLNEILDDGITISYGTFNKFCKKMIKEQENEITPKNNVAPATSQQPTETSQDDRSAAVPKKKGPTVARPKKNKEKSELERRHEADKLKL